MVPDTIDTAGPSVWTALGTAPFRVAFEDISGTRTRILEAGQGEPLVLMHGTGGHLEAFARNVHALARHFRVVAYDFPGHGYSSLAGADLEIADYEAHLLALMDSIGASRVHLMGESLGGWVAARFAAHHPDRVAKLILNTPGGRTADPVVMNRIRTLTQEAVDDPDPQRVRARLEWLMADPASVTDELVVLRRAIYSRPGFSESIRHVLCLVREGTRHRNLVTDEELAAISAPTLVVWTSDDPSAAASVGRDIAERVDGARFELIPEAGHWPQWEQPDVYNRLTLEFLGPGGAASGGAA